MAREFRQCWAYYEGNRCSLRAGHAGDHVRKVTWADSDSQGAPLIEVLAVDAPIPFVPVEAPKSDKCVACQHQHRPGECKCGCKEFIG